ncbi:MAG: PfkB family carbohydrate kinase, partial [Rhodospirillales bacterium]|nr:PfkB family carbohydrate kinase [Rhodospirillales bacterium]
MLDVITLGRASVDLYGQQVGGRLEDMGSFAKYVGGCPANIAIGCARLGLKAGLITRVGDEHLGRFIREQLAVEGVELRGVRTDPERLTALVVLGIRDDETFPLIFYREN